MALPKLVCLAFAALLLSLPSIALSPVGLDGDFILGGPLDHNGSIHPGDSYLYLSLENDSASALYRALPGDAFEDPCTGFKLKAAGNVICYETSPNAHFCSFSVNLKENTVEAGVGGCF